MNKLALLMDIFPLPIAGFARMRDVWPVLTDLKTKGTILCWKLSKLPVLLPIFCWCLELL